ncbi:hypothetical protein ABG768_018671 [Culter alburnus]|uniref:HECT domain-containing protein n=1 Tax=Culter alburnus TaxID=194366 RepID=A0AAW2ASW3_CULAL
MSMKSFCPSKRIDVKFMDDLGASEGAIDSGGPRREFLTLLMENLKQGALFVGPDEAKFLNFNSRSMQNDDYFYAGVAIALSIVHGGPGPQFISPSLFKALTINPEATVISVEEVTDPMLCPNLQRLASGDYDAFNNIESIIDMAGTFAVIKDHQTARKVACTLVLSWSQPVCI